MSRNIGVVVFAVGAALLDFAYHFTNAPLEELSNKFTDRHSTETTRYLAVEIAAAVGIGLHFTFVSRKLRVAATQPDMERAMSPGMILIIILLLMMVGALPSWPHSRNWGYYPTGGLGLVLVIVLVLLLLGRI